MPEAICKRCIHHDICDSYSGFDIVTFFPYNEDCEYFKSRQDYSEVQHAKWIPYEQPVGVGYSIPNYKPTHCCSHCKGFGWEFYTICPHCGVNMKEQSDDNDT